MLLIGIIIVEYAENVCGVQRCQSLVVLLMLLLQQSGGLCDDRLLTLMS